MHTSSVSEKGESPVGQLLLVLGSAGVAPGGSRYISLTLSLSPSSIVEYATHEDMKNALRKLDGADLNGRRLKLIDDSRSSRRRRSVTLLLLEIYKRTIVNHGECTIP